MLPRHCTLVHICPFLCASTSPPVSIQQLQLKCCLIISCSDCCVSMPLPLMPPLLLSWNDGPVANNHAAAHVDITPAAAVAAAVHVDITPAAAAHSLPLHLPLLPLLLLSFNTNTHECSGGAPSMCHLAFVNISLGSLQGMLQAHVAASLLCQLALPCCVIMLPLSRVRQGIGQLLLGSLLCMLCCQYPQLLLLYLQHSLLLQGIAGCAANWANEGAY